MKDSINAHVDKNYSIFWDKDTNILFGYIELEDEELWSKQADMEINRKWWDFMVPVMETNPDNSPLSIDVKEMFHLD